MPEKQKKEKKTHKIQELCLAAISYLRYAYTFLVKNAFWSIYPVLCAKG